MYLDRSIDLYIHTYIHTDLHTRAYQVFDPSRSFKVNRLALGCLISRLYLLISTDFIAGRLDVYYSHNDINHNSNTITYTNTAGLFCLGYEQVY